MLADPELEDLPCSSCCCCALFFFVSSSSFRVLASYSEYLSMGVPINATGSTGTLTRVKNCLAGSTLKCPRLSTWKESKSGLFSALPS